jgi:predicted DNA-binding protein YlxM (UPF0122 family)
MAAETFNISIYKLSKAMIKDIPKLLNLLDKMEQSMVIYQVYSPIRDLLKKIKETKEEMQQVLENAKKVKDIKGRIE